MTKFVALAFAALMAAGLAGCQGENPAQSPAEIKQYEKAGG